MPPHMQAAIRITRLSALRSAGLTKKPARTGRSVTFVEIGFR